MDLHEMNKLIFPRYHGFFLSFELLSTWLCYVLLLSLKLQVQNQNVMVAGWHAVRGRVVEKTICFYGYDNYTRQQESK